MLKSILKKTKSKDQVLHVTVLYDFIAQDNMELTVSAQQVLVFVEKLQHPGWSKCKNIQTNEQGYIPTAYHSEPYPPQVEFSEEDIVTADDSFKSQSMKISQATRKLTKRRELVKETLKTEEIYVGNLTIFCSVYAKEAKELKIVSDADYQAMFGQVTKILSVNEVLLESLKKGIAEAGGAGFEEMCLIGKVFEQTAPFLKIYTEYINEYDIAYEAFSRLSKGSAPFKQYLQACKSKLSQVWKSGLACDFATLLINPVQRIPRYQMLLQQIVEATDEKFEDYEPTKQALSKIYQVAQHCNSSKAIKDSVRVYYAVANMLSRELAYNTFIQPYRRFICDIEVGLSFMTKDGYNFGEDEAEIKELNYRAYLFSDALILERVTPDDGTERVHLIFLQFCTVGKSANTMVKLLSYSGGSKQTIMIIANSNTKEYMDQFTQMKSNMSEWVTITHQNMSARYKLDTSLHSMACSRFLALENKYAAEAGLQECQIQTIHLSKKLHTNSNIIAQKEEQVKKLQEELKLLHAEKTEMRSSYRSVQERSITHEKNLENKLLEISSLDSILYGCMNEDPSSFKAVFQSKPMIIKLEQGTTRNDLYKGKKLRRRGSLIHLNPHSCDYTALSINPMMDQLQKKYGEMTIQFSSVVHYVNEATLVRLVITDQLVLGLNGASSTVKCKIPRESIVYLSVSKFDDNLFCIHTTDHMDFVFSSVKKTEILDMLSSHGSALAVNVSAAIIYQTGGANHELRTLTFEPTNENVEFIVEQVSNEVSKVKYNPESVDYAYLSNKILIQKEDHDKQWVYMQYPLVDKTTSSSDDAYGGSKHRRMASTSRAYRGDYLTHTRGTDLKRLAIDPSDVKFCDYITRYSDKLKAVTVVMVITSSHIYFVDATLRYSLGTISLSCVSKISVSSYSDNYICIHSKEANGIDELLYSEKKTEMIDYLRNSTSCAVQVVNGAATFSRLGKMYTGVFIDGSVDNFELIGPCAFKVTVSKHSISTAVFESMDVYIDGVTKPVVVCTETQSIPCVKLPAESDRSFFATIHYYAMEDMIGYHIEQKIGTQEALTVIEDCPKSTNKYKMNLKKQQINPPKYFEKSRRLTTKVLDHFGNVVAIFYLDFLF